MNTPSELSQVLLEQSAEYGRLSDQLIDILKAKPWEWTACRAEVSSDTAAERLWQASEKGKDEVPLRLKLKALEKSMSAIKTRLRVQEMEIRNLV